MRRACRWSAVPLTFALAFLGYVAAPHPLDRTEDKDRPNVVFLLADDMDVAAAEAMPILQREVVDEGLSMSRFFAGFPLCCPSRASILRGQHAHNTGVVSNRASNSFPAFHASGKEQSTVATWLQDGGYRTGMIGKYLNHYPRGAGGNYVPPGWDEWRVSVRHGTSGFDYTLNENGRRVAHGDEPGEYYTDVMSQAATEFVRAAEEPFFLYLAPHAPHSPATPAPRHVDLFADAVAPRSDAFNEVAISDKPTWIRDLPRLSVAEVGALDELHRQRLRSLQAVDEMLGSVLEALAERGELDNTYVVFTSDNGYTLGGHRRGATKNSMYEEDIGVPFFVRGPGVPAGRTVEHLAANIDLAPTFADLAGVPAPDFVDGRSLVPLWQPDPPAESAWRRALLLEHEPTGLGEDDEGPDDEAPEDEGDEGDEGDEDKGEAADRRRPWLVNLSVIPSFRGVRTDRYAYVEYWTGERELYDLDEDPHELDNLAETADPELVSGLSDTLAGLVDCEGAQCRAAEDEATAD